jgi:Glycosyltransferase family 87
MLTVKRNVGLILVLGSIASLICFGIVGIGRAGGASYGFGFDFAVLYAAGRTWLEGANPYNHNELSRSVAGIEGIGSLKGFGFFYPPQSAAFFITTALFSFPVAKVVWLGFNLLSIAAIVAMTVSSINQYQQKKRDNIGRWLMAAVAIGNPFTTHIVWMGQTSLVAFAATMAAWFFSNKNKSILAGICLGLASFKPQMCALLGNSGFFRNRLCFKFLSHIFPRFYWDATSLV